MNSAIPKFIKAGLFIVTTCFASSAFSQNLTDSVIRKNVHHIPNPLESINRLEPRVYEYDVKNYKDLKLPAGRQYGFLTENLQEVFPDMVKTENRSYLFGKNNYRTAKIKTVDAESLVPVLVASIQQLQAQIDQLKSEIQQLRKTE